MNRSVQRQQLKSTPQNGSTNPGLSVCLFHCLTLLSKKPTLQWSSTTERRRSWWQICDPAAKSLISALHLCANVHSLCQCLHHCRVQRHLLISGRLNGFSCNRPLSVWNPQRFTFIRECVSVASQWRGRKEWVSPIFFRLMLLIKRIKTRTHKL